MDVALSLTCTETGVLVVAVADVTTTTSYRRATTTAQSTRFANMTEEYIHAST